MKIVSLNIHFWSNEEGKFAGAELFDFIASLDRDVYCLQEVYYSAGMLAKGTNTFDEQKRGTPVKISCESLHINSLSVCVDTTSDSLLRKSLLRMLGLPKAQQYELIDMFGIPVKADTVSKDSEYTLQLAKDTALVDHWAHPNQLIEGTALSMLAKRLQCPYAVFSGTDSPNFGNCILSKFPFTQTHTAYLPLPESFKRDWGSRTLTSALIETPVREADRDREREAGSENDCSGKVWVHCTHLDHVSEDARMVQIKEAVESMPSAHAHDSLPAVLVGDFNALLRTDYTDEQWAEIKRIRGQSKWEEPKGDVLTEILSQGWYDSCQISPLGTVSGSVAGTCRFGTRIDYVLVSHKLLRNVRTYKIVATETTDHNAVCVKVDIV
ncbi:PGAP2-interacting protein [Kipferlia bialata]|uniref:PGAP2-interacting protein n=1 Tax=Kipferlia bialata TaxID=797122 RepID=A0A9K3D325_9EUKA|nr:PGAP2-interacting protein [Kipferlia bialata]|eukprot:g8220.t1